MKKPLQKLTPELSAAFTAGLIQGSNQPKNLSHGDEMFTDDRPFACPSCGSFGMNTMMGFTVYACGAEIVADPEDVIFDKPCGGAKG